MRRNRDRLSLSRRERWPVFAVFALVLLPAAVFIWVANRRTSRAATVLADKDLRLREADVDKGELCLFSYPVDPRTRFNFLVRRKENGAVEVAFGSCRRCFQAGSYPQGNKVIRGHCREPMEVLQTSVPVSPEQDCALLPLQYERREGQLIVQRDDRKRKFDQWFRSVRE